MPDYIIYHKMIKGLSLLGTHDVIKAKNKDAAIRKFNRSLHARLQNKRGQKNILQ